MTGNTSDVLIIGAGLAGLVAAQELQTAGYSVQLVDKGRSVGGRLATRRIGSGQADHGAQFFTVRTPEFQARVDAWIAAGLVFQWSSGWSDGSLIHNAPADGYPRYAVRDGMNALAKHLVKKLPSAVNTRIESIESHPAGWRCTAENGAMFTSRALLLTPPVPQSLALLEAAHVQLAPADRAALETIRYAPCLAGIFAIDGQAALPEPGAVQRPQQAIRWIADNQRKGISPGARLLTVHASPDYSAANWDAPEADVLAFMRQEVTPYLHENATITEAQLKRWRYALPTICHNSRALLARNLPPLAFAGDAFGGPRIEGAALSGMAAGQALIAQLATH